MHMAAFTPWFPPKVGRVNDNNRRVSPNVITAPTPPETLPLKQHMADQCLWHPIKQKKTAKQDTEARLIHKISP
jgi:hypothetical protein